jgi:hypothetical protein
MRGNLVVNSWVGIHEGCDITYRVDGDDGVYVTVSGHAEPFEFFFEAAALRDFITRGTEALAELPTPVG